LRSLCEYFDRGATAEQIRAELENSDLDSRTRSILVLGLSRHITAHRCSRCAASSDEISKMLFELSRTSFRELVKTKAEQLGVEAKRPLGAGKPTSSAATSPRKSVATPF